jgi:HSP20 family protein
MTITQYQTWARPQRFENEIKGVLNRFFADGAENTGWTPRVDIREEDTRFVILADVPGVDTKDIEISMDKGVLSIKGERKSLGNEDSAKVTRVERSSGTFQRSFTLPDSVDAESVTAAGKNGVLEIAIPKKAQAAPRRIEISN